MTEMEKMKAGLEYSYADEELEARKTQAILWCEEYNAIDGRDFEAQYAYLKKGGVRDIDNIVEGTCLAALAREYGLAAAYSSPVVR